MIRRHRRYRAVIGWLRAWNGEFFIGGPVHVRQGDANPIDQARAGTLNLKNLTTKIGVTAFVQSLVTVVAQPRHPITIVKKGMPRGMDVRVGSLKELRSWHQTKTCVHKVFWAAEQAHALMRALDFGHAVTLADLIDHGR